MKINQQPCCSCVVKPRYVPAAFTDRTQSLFSSRVKSTSPNGNIIRHSGWGKPLFLGHETENNAGAVLFCSLFVLRFKSIPRFIFVVVGSMSDGKRRLWIFMYGFYSFSWLERVAFTARETLLSGCIKVSFARSWSLHIISETKLSAIHYTNSTISFIRAFNRLVYHILS